MELNTTASWPLGLQHDAFTNFILTISYGVICFHVDCGCDGQKQGKKISQKKIGNYHNQAKHYEIHKLNTELYIPVGVSPL